MILWRIDDVAFSPTVEARPLTLAKLDGLIDVFVSRRLAVTIALITRHEGLGLAEHPALAGRLRLWSRRGIPVITHGMAHDKERSYVEMGDDEIAEELDGLKRDFAELGLPFAWFCYPFNHRNEHTNALVHASGLRIVQVDYADWAKVSTVTKWRDPALSPEKLEEVVRLARGGASVMVEDHCWFYQGERELRLLATTLDALAGIPFVSVETRDGGR